LKKFWKAVSKSARDCCKGILETSLNQALSSVFLAWVLLFSEVQQSLAFSQTVCRALGHHSRLLDSIQTTELNSAVADESDKFCIDTLLSLFSVTYLLYYTRLYQQN